MGGLEPGAVSPDEVQGQGQQVRHTAPELHLLHVRPRDVDLFAWSAHRSESDVATKVLAKMMLTNSGAVEKADCEIEYC